MPTRRVPIHRPQRRQFSARALEAFTRMQSDWDETTDAWWKHHAMLHTELRAKPWEWPVVEHPDYACDFPPGSPGAKAFAEAVALYHELEAASKKF